MDLLEIYRNNIHLAEKEHSDSKGYLKNLRFNSEALTKIKDQLKLTPQFEQCDLEIVDCPVFKHEGKIISMVSGWFMGGKVFKGSVKLMSILIIKMYYGNLREDEDDEVLLRHKSKDGKSKFVTMFRFWDDGNFEYNEEIKHGLYEINNIE